MAKGLKKLKQLFWYSDSEPNEVLIAFCHLFCLPLAIYHDFIIKNYFLLVMGCISGAYQLYAVLLKGCIKCRLFAVSYASVIAIGTCFSLYYQGMLKGSQTGWCIILIFALWNMLRVYREVVIKYG